MRRCGDEEGEDVAELDGEEVSWKCEVVLFAKRFERCNLPDSELAGYGTRCRVGWIIAIRSFDSGAAGRLQRSPEHISMTDIEQIDKELGCADFEKVWCSLKGRVLVEFAGYEMNNTMWIRTCWLASLCFGIHKLKWLWEATISPTCGIYPSWLLVAVKYLLIVKRFRDDQARCDTL